MSAEWPEANGPPARPCGGCGGRDWQQRTAAPAGGWECPACARAEAVAMARTLGAIVQGRFTYRALDLPGDDAGRPG